MVKSRASLIHSFASTVENAISSTEGNLGALRVHCFSSTVENMISSADGDFGALPVHGYASTVENAISSTDGNFGALRVHCFASTVENAISSTDENFGALRVHCFASTVENMVSSTEGDFGALPGHDFASTVENATSNIGGDLGISHSPGHGFQLFTLAELAAATKNFSVDNKICVGSSSVVYRGKLVDGREVAIERVENWSSRTPVEAFWFRRMSSLTFSRGVRPKNLVEQVGLCEEKDERLLVYECMKNGSLYDHLHEKGSNVLNSWKMRIKIGLDASRGIEYLHKYGVPSGVHGDIKPSNIFLDATWTAKVSNFGKAAGTIGYIDPEDLSRGVLTEKSDVYGFGVVLLELLTGKRPTDGKDGGTTLHVPFVEAAILAGDFLKILDSRVGEPHLTEAKALELVAHTAVNCVNVEGKVRPSIAEVVVSLETAFTYLLICCQIE